MQGVDVNSCDRRWRRVVAANQKSDHGRVVPQQTRLARHRGCGHLLVRSVPRFATGLRCRFPFVAAFPARQDHDAVTVGEIVKPGVLQLALTADGVEAEIADVTELGLHALGVVAQEHVRRPARAPNQHRLAIDDELEITVLGEVGGDAADAKCRARLVRDRTINGGIHLQSIERMPTHADRPPDLRMFEVESRIALGGKQYRLRFTGSEVDRSPQ